MKRLSFRARLLWILLAFAVVPSVVLMIAGTVVVSRTLPLLGGGDAWERVATSGRDLAAQLDTTRLDAEQRRALLAHEQELNGSLEQARRVRYLAGRAPMAMLALAIIGIGVLALVGSRVAAHLSRQLSRPVNELVGWTELIANGQPLPEQAPRKPGAPEFSILRRRMRRMAEELDVARERELEAERLSAFREAARRVAHELKNPLTPIRFAVSRLKRDAPPLLADTVAVLETESARLESLARSFAQFGRLPEGPPSEIDVLELVRYTARASVPEGMRVTVHASEEVPLAWGQHEALARALSNVFLNAVDACADGGSIDVAVSPARLGDTLAVSIAVTDTGLGIAPERLATIWEPYATSKPGGTGLGLAIARQAVEASGGTVAAESQPGAGTTIRFTIPAATTANGDGRRITAAAASTLDSGALSHRGA